jgi:hypothetical protein
MFPSPCPHLFQGASSGIQILTSFPAPPASLPGRPNSSTQAAAPPGLIPAARAAETTARRPLSPDAIPFVPAPLPIKLNDEAVEVRPKMAIPTVVAPPPVAAYPGTDTIRIWPMATPAAGVPCSLRRLHFGDPLTPPQAVAVRTFAELTASDPGPFVKARKVVPLVPTAAAHTQLYQEHLVLGRSEWVWVCLGHRS